MASDRKEERQQRREQRIEDAQKRHQARSDARGSLFFTNGDGDDQTFTTRADLPRVSKAQTGKVLRSIFKIPDQPTIDPDSIPEDDIRVSQGGAVSVEPQVISKWEACYFYPERYRDALANMTFILIPLVYILLILITVFSPTIRGFFIVAIVFLVIIHVNVALRLYNRALWSWPIPSIPFISPLIQASLYDIDVNKVRAAKEELAREDAKEKVLAKVKSGEELSPEERIIRDATRDNVKRNLPQSGSTVFGDYVRGWMVDNGVLLDDVSVLSGDRLTGDILADVITGSRPVTPPVLMGLAKMSSEPFQQWQAIYQEMAESDNL